MDTAEITTLHKSRIIVKTVDKVNWSLGIRTDAVIIFCKTKKKTSN